MVLRLKPDKREEKDRIRDELQRAALSLGAAHGFASLGLREVARDADIAPTSLALTFRGRTLAALPQFASTPALPPRRSPSAGWNEASPISALRALVAAGKDHIPLPGHGATLKRWQQLAAVGPCGTVFCA